MMKKKRNFINLTVLYIVLGVTFLLITILNIYTYRTISSMSNTYAELGFISRGFRMEFQNALLELRDVLLADAPRKTLEDVWKSLDKAGGHADGLGKLDSNLEGLRLNIKRFMDDAKKAKSEEDINIRETLLEKCDRYFQDADKKVNAFESKIKDMIEVEMGFVRFVYIIILFMNVVMFGGLFFVIFMNDKTAKQTAKELADDNMNLNALISGFDSIIFTIDNTGLIRTWNTNAERYFEMPAEDAIGKNIYSAFPFFSQLTSFLETALYSNKRMYKFHELLAVNRGPLRSLNILCVPIMSSSFKSGYSEILLKIDDVTTFFMEELRLELNRKIQAMNDMLESFERDASPLMESMGGSMDSINVIADNSGMTQQVAPYTGYMRNMLAQIGILPQTYHAAVTGITTGASQIELNEMIMYVLRLSSKTFDTRVSIEVSLNESKSWVNASPMRLFFMLLNIVSNAEDAMVSQREAAGASPEQIGGILSVSVEKISGEKVAADKMVRFRQAIKESAYWIVMISDTGVGMTPEIKASIFDPFFTTKDKMEHRGLGLSCVADAVNEIGGYMDVNTKPGSGTVFKLFIPESPETNSAYGESATDDSLNADDSSIIHGNGGTLLLCINEPLLGRIMSKFFIAIGYNVIYAENGFKAVQLYLENQASIGCVMLDITTKYMTSADTYFQLKSINPDVKVIISGNIDEAVAQLKETGFNNFVVKPYPLNVLTDMIAKAFQE